MPEIQEVVKSDFLVLPCDLVCEVPGERLQDIWMVHEVGLRGLNGEEGGRRGGLGVWYHARREGSSKQDETDFLITTPFQNPGTDGSHDRLDPSLQQIVYSTTKDTLCDILDEKGLFPLRTRLLETFGKVNMLSHYRDAHVYFFHIGFCRWSRRILQWTQSARTLSAGGPEVRGNRPLQRSLGSSIPCLLT